jgi:hypothetical protein
MSTSQRLTKKQKKGLAFRERKTGKRQQGKGRHKNELSGMEYNAIPFMEGEALLGLEGDPAQDQGVPRKEVSKTCRHEEGDVVQHKKGKSGSKSKGDAEKEDVSVSVAVLKGKKRTREDDGVEAEGREDRVEVDGRSKSKRKKAAEEEEEEEEEKQQKNQPKQKFILFIGEFFPCLLHVCLLIFHFVLNLFPRQSEIHYDTRKDRESFCVMRCVLLYPYISVGSLTYSSLPFLLSQILSQGSVCSPRKSRLDRNQNRKVALFWNSHIGTLFSKL